jgi:hypothetical protein
MMERETLGWIRTREALGWIRTSDLYHTKIVLFLTELPEHFS